MQKPYSFPQWSINGSHQQSWYSHTHPLFDIVQPFFAWASSPTSTFNDALHDAQGVVPCNVSKSHHFSPVDSGKKRFLVSHKTFNPFLHKLIVFSPLIENAKVFLMYLFYKSLDPSLCICQQCLRFHIHIGEWRLPAIIVQSVLCLKTDLVPPYSCQFNHRCHGIVIFRFSCFRILSVSL